MFEAQVVLVRSEEKWMFLREIGRGRGRKEAEIRGEGEGFK